MNKKDFDMLKNNNSFLDNGATTLTPNSVIESMNEYYRSYTSNIHRGDYDAAIKTNEVYDSTRDVIKKFVGAKDSDKVIYTSGTTMSLNLVIYCFMKYRLKKGDKVLISLEEHASNVLPWFKLKEDIGIEIDYYKDLDSIDSNVKVISLAGITNVLGNVRELENIGNYCKKNNIYFVVDGAQSVPHMKTEFSKCNIDFLAFSAHKMCGPTGIGALVVRSELFSDMKPLFYGGGMNLDFDKSGNYTLHTDESLFEAGTPAIAEVVGFREAINYLDSIGMDKIHEYEIELKKYALDKLSKLDNIIIYSNTCDSGILSFNVNGVFAQDVSIYLNKHKISVRAGNHCAKLVHNIIGVKNSVRVSFYFYNDYEDIDKLVEALDNDNILEEVI